MGFSYLCNLLTHWKARCHRVHSNKHVPYMEDFANTLESLLCHIGPEKQHCPLRRGLYNHTVWRTLQPLWEAYLVSCHIGPERQTCPLCGGLCDHFGKLIPCHPTWGQKDKCAPYVEDFATTLGSLFHVMPHGARKTNVPLTWRTLRPLWEAYSNLPHHWAGK